jgi:hypothetical protein
MSEADLREELRKTVDHLTAARSLRIRLQKKMRLIGPDHPDFLEAKRFADETLQLLNELQERRAVIANNLRKSRTSPDFVEQARHKKARRNAAGELQLPVRQKHSLDTERN